MKDELWLTRFRAGATITTEMHYEIRAIVVALTRAKTALEDNLKLLDKLALELSR